MSWSQIEGLDAVDAIESPGLLVDLGRVNANIQAMIDLVGGPDQVGRLRPHVKTHKMPEMIRLQVGMGITSFKAATLAEAEMVAKSGGTDVLIAYPMVGPNIDHLSQLIKQYPATGFSSLVDHRDTVEMLAGRVPADQVPRRVFIDVDCGMHRTGIPIGEELEWLRKHINALPSLEYGGLHVYDGHLHAVEPELRTAAASEIISTIRKYEEAHPSPTVIGGGSPTFPRWAQERDWECSPGTSVFWDVGYQEFSDLNFSVAVALLTRVISKPGDSRICLDLGTKAVASEMSLENRVTLPAIDDAEFVSQNEEHLVIETKHASEISIGQTFMAFPRHICPTINLYSSATIINDRRAISGKWSITARR